MTDKEKIKILCDALAYYANYDGTQYGLYVHEDSVLDGFFPDEGAAAQLALQMAHE